MVLSHGGDVFRWERLAVALTKKISSTNELHRKEAAAVLSACRLDFVFFAADMACLPLCRLTRSFPFLFAFSKRHRWVAVCVQSNNLVSHGVKKTPNMGKNDCPVSY